MAESFFDRVYKQGTHTPDVLSCLANLSNDEVFTPPEIVNHLLDMLPQELFESTKTTFLDPACKTGVFLREIAKRLLNAQMPGYQDRMEEINNKKALGTPLSASDAAFTEQLQARVDHIFHNQLYGIAITELTSLLSRRSVYCSMYPNGKYSITKFDNPEGNIRFRRIQHTWEGSVTYDDEGRPNRKCKYCGANESEWKRDDALETYAYEFIHMINIQEAFKMAFFDVIVSNPPYQLNDGGYGKSAKPIYQLFVDKAKKLNPRFLTMIIPSRWFSGGRGLDDFRADMLSDKHIKKIVDFESFKDVFPGVDLAGGACYFLWDREYNGKCEIVNRANNKEDIVAERYLDEFDVFVRSNKAVSIINKVKDAHKGKYMNETVSPSKPFGLRTFYEPKQKGIPCQFIQKIGLKYADPKDVTDSLGILDKWKFIVPRSPIAGQTDFTKPVGFYYDGNTRILPPGTCCTESFIVLFSSDSEEEVKAFKSYIFTKVARYLLLQCVVSQDVTKDKFRFVPSLDSYAGQYTDEMLCKKWEIAEDEWKLIDSKVATITDTGFDLSGGDE